MKKIVYAVSLTLVIMLLNACASSEKIVYFQDIEGLKVNDSLVNFEPKIQVGDILAINVSAIDGEAAIPFNLYETPIVGKVAPSGNEPLNYIVNADGDIYFPVIGNLRVGGLTTKQLNEKLTEILGTYIKNPTINISITNFKITVMGQVKNPGTYTIPNERISILAALGLAGDLEIHGKRKNVMLIREENGKRMFVNIDLTNKELFNSPYYYLAQNDVIYVEPNKVQVNAAAIGANTSVILGSISILLSIITILLI